MANPSTMNTIDKQIGASVPFLRRNTILYVESSEGTLHAYFENNSRLLADRFGEIGYMYLYLPEFLSSLFPNVLNYMFPLQGESLLPEEMYHRLQDLSKIGDRSGFLYRKDGRTYFREIPESSSEDLDSLVGAFIDSLSFTEVNSLVQRKKRKAPRKVIPLLNFSVIEKVEDLRLPCHNEPISFSTREREEDQLDPRTQSIVDEWEALSRKYGITIEDLMTILGSRVKFSRLYITTSNRIYLPDYEGNPEVKLDDLTKALYFFYLRHPEGATFKELQSWEEEILRIYMGITGRDDLEGIRRSVSSLVSPYSDGRNSCVSRIKKAFRDIVGDHLAKYYYIDGKYAETRSVRIDRDLVIWEH